MNPKAVLEFAAANSVKIVDIRFTDLPGLWQHVSFPIHELEESSFEEGFGMDGSSIRSWFLTRAGICLTRSQKHPPWP
jgi:glutamine synthetase